MQSILNYTLYPGLPVSIFAHSQGKILYVKAICICENTQDVRNNKKKQDKTDDQKSTRHTYNRWVLFCLAQFLKNCAESVRQGPIVCYPEMFEL